MSSKLVDPIGVHVVSSISVYGYLYCICFTCSVYLSMIRINRLLFSKAHENVRGWLPLSVSTFYFIELRSTDTLTFGVISGKLLPEGGTQKLPCGKLHMVHSVVANTKMCWFMQICLDLFYALCKSTCLKNLSSFNTFISSIYNEMWEFLAVGNYSCWLQRIITN